MLPLAIISRLHTEPAIFSYPLQLWTLSLGILLTCNMSPNLPGNLFTKCQCSFLRSITKQFQFPFSRIKLYTTYSYISMRTSLTNFTVTLWILVDRLILQTFRNNNGFQSILTGPRFVINWMHVTGSNAVRETVLCERQERKCLLHWSTRLPKPVIYPFAQAIRTDVHCLYKNIVSQLLPLHTSQNTLSDVLPSCVSLNLFPRWKKIHYTLCS